MANQEKLSQNNDTVNHRQKKSKGPKGQKKLPVKKFNVQVEGHEITFSEGTVPAEISSPDQQKSLKQIKKSEGGTGLEIYTDNNIQGHFQSLPSHAQRVCSCV